MPVCVTRGEMMVTERTELSTWPEGKGKKQKVFLHQTEIGIERRGMNWKNSRNRGKYPRKGIFDSLFSL